MQPATVSTQQKTQRLNVSVNIAMMPSIYWKLFHCYNHCRDVHGDHCEMTQDSSWFTNLFKEVCSCHYCSYYLCCLRFQLRKDQERSWQPRQVHFRRRECGGKVQVCCSAINLKKSRPDFDKNWEALKGTNFTTAAPLTTECRLGTFYFSASQLHVKLQRCDLHWFLFQFHFLHISSLTWLQYQNIGYW